MSGLYHVRKPLFRLSCTLSKLSLSRKWGLGMKFFQTQRSFDVGITYASQVWQSFLLHTLVSNYVNSFHVCFAFKGYESLSLLCFTECFP